MRTVLFAIVATIVLAGCGSPHRDPLAIERQGDLVGADTATYDATQAHADAIAADARLRAARNDADRVAAQADRDAALKREAEAKRLSAIDTAKAKAAEEALAASDDRAEKLRWRRDAALSFVSSAAVAFLASRLPLVSGALWVISGLGGVVSTAFLFCAWMVDYRWLVPTGFGALGLGVAIRHLLAHHDALLQIVRHGGVDLRAVAGKAVALCQRIHNWSAYHLPAIFRQKEPATPAPAPAPVPPQARPVTPAVASAPAAPPAPQPPQVGEPDVPTPAALAAAKMRAALPPT